MAGATWFLRSLFCITIVNAVITYLLKNIISKKTYVFIAMVVAAIGMQLVNNNVGSISLLVEKIGLQSFFAGYFAYLIGMILKKTTYMQFVKQHTLSCFLLSGGGLLLLNFIGKIQLNVGHVENVAFFALSSLLGWILVYILSINSKWIASCVEYIGKHSVWILGLHFLSFKIVTMVYLKIVPESKATLAAYPVVYENNILWIAYTLAGIIAPLLVGYIWHKLFSFLKSMEIYRNNASVLCLRVSGRWKIIRQSARAQGEAMCAFLTTHYQRTGVRLLTVRSICWKRLLRMKLFMRCWLF